MSLDPFATGDALRSVEGEVARLWRAARDAARPGVFPGLLDGIVGSLVDRAAAALAAGGGDPAEVVEGVEGVVRIDPRFRRRSAGELEAELAILGTVLDTVCEAMSAGPQARAFLSAVVAAGREQASPLAHGRAPEGVLVVLALSGTAPARRTGADG